MSRRRDTAQVARTAPVGTLGWALDEMMAVNFDANTRGLSLHFWGKVPYRPSARTLLRRARYGGRKGRRALRRMVGR